MFKFRKGEATEHSEIKNIQYGVFVTLSNDSWEFRTIEEVNIMKSEMDKQIRELMEKAKNSIN